MAEWLEQASQRHAMCSHDLEVISTNPGVLVLLSKSKSCLNQICHLHIQHNFAGCDKTWSDVSVFFGVFVGTVFTNKPRKIYDNAHIMQMPIMQKPMHYPYVNTVLFTSICLHNLHLWRLSLCVMQIQTHIINALYILLKLMVLSLSLISIPYSSCRLVAQCVARQDPICSNAYGGWFAPRARHSVRMTYIGLALLCSCSGALEYPTTNSCGPINESILSFLP